MNYVEFANQFITLTILNFLFAFSDFTNTSAARTTTGWIILGLFLVQFVLNIVLSAYLMFKFLKYKVCKKIIKTRRLKNVISIRSLKAVD